jgi:hypothetical protein
VVLVAPGLIIGLIGLASSAWVAQDSTKYDWSKWRHPTHPEWNNAAESPMTWFLVCFLLWPCFFPGYFWDRKYAPRQMSEAIGSSSN